MDLFDRRVTFAFIFALELVLVSSDRANLPEDDSSYINPNNYFTSRTQNQHIQDVLQKYNQDARYRNPSTSYLPPLNADLLDKLGSTQDPRYVTEPSRYADQNLRPGNRGYQSDRVDINTLGSNNRDRYRDRNQNRYDVYSDSGRGDPPRQYFEHDPQYSLREDEILKILAQIDISASQQCNMNVRAQWDFETNVNEVNQIRAVSAF